MTAPSGSTTEITLSRSCAPRPRPRNWRPVLRRFPHRETTQALAVPARRSGDVQLIPAGIGPLESESVDRVRLLAGEIFYCAAPQRVEEIARFLPIVRSEFDRSDASQVISRTRTRAPPGRLQEQKLQPSTEPTRTRLPPSAVSMGQRPITTLKRFSGIAQWNWWPSEVRLDCTPRKE
jgi:hypothetical protein